MIHPIQPGEATEPMAQRGTRRNATEPSERDTAVARSQAGPSLLVRLEAAFDRYPTALVRAAQYIVENPDKVVHQSVAELSSYAGVGQASVVRLCRDLGYDGFTEFKIALATDLAVRSAKDPARAQSGDPLTEVARLLCESITETRELMDDKTLRAVARGVSGAVRIDLFGSGVSGMIADLIAYRLLRLGFHASCVRDAILAHEISSGLGPNTAAIAISQSGATPDTVKFLKYAKAAGAFTVALTCHPKSALAKVAHRTLTMARLREPTYGGPITDVPRAVLIAEALAMALTRAVSEKE
jgi:DNA-binding MurR/RpiR family transcriptional regulator